MKSKSWTAATTGTFSTVPAPTMHGIDRAGLGAGVAQAIGVAALVAELQRVERHVGERDRLPLAAVEEMLEALLRASSACGSRSRG